MDSSSGRLSPFGLLKTSTAVNQRGAIKGAKRCLASPTSQKGRSSVTLSLVRNEDPLVGRVTLPATSNLPSVNGDEPPAVVVQIAEATYTHECSKFRGDDVSMHTFPFLEVAKSMFSVQALLRGS